MTEKVALFGITQENIKHSPAKIKEANHIILIAKMCISKQKYGKIKNLWLILERELLLRKKYLSLELNQFLYHNNP